MCHVTSALTNQRRVFKLCLTQTERVSDDVTRKIGPLDFKCPNNEEDFSKFRVLLKKSKL